MSERVILINMPFGAIERPALSLGLLKAHCERAGVPCDVRYFTLDFAERIGLGDYLWLCSEDVPYTAFVGEWIFAEALYGARPDADAEYIEEVLRSTWRVSGADLARFRRVRTQAVPFLDDCLRSVKWSDYTLVGFTSVFQQNLASLALADRLKRAHPEITIAFGGANWEEKMGVALQAAFPFVDLAFSGEADETFPSVLRARREQRSVEGIAGVTVRGSVAPASVAPIGIMDAVPIPDFDSFFRQFSKSSVGSAITPTLLLETARGCWWGERSHCTFCGLNGATMAFRSKTPDRVLKEIMYLRARHGVRTFNVVDDILDMSYFDTVLPRIADARLDIDFFWEIKANLTHHHIRSLSLAGVLAVQPGIESFSDRVLKLMRKGTTAFRNIEVLKWCREYGVKPYWNLLYGFPGETIDDYERTVALITAIWHLDPPTACGPIRIDRFSPYHRDPSRFGMVNMRPMAPFRYLYPFDAESLADISYYFEFDYADGRGASDMAGAAIATADAWSADKARGMLQMRENEDGSLELSDTRTSIEDTPKEASIHGWKAAVFLACDRAQPLSALLGLREVRGVSEAKLRAFLGRCVEHALIVTNGNTWLNVAVHVPARLETSGASVRVAPIGSELNVSAL